MEESIDAGDEDNENSENRSKPSGANLDENENESSKSMFKCLIVTGHNDSTIKIWNENVITKMNAYLPTIKRDLNQNDVYLFKYKQLE